MTRPIAVLRPEPGDARTAQLVEAAGSRAIRLPLFLVAPVAWTPPDPAGFDALLLTSANAARLAGPGLDALAGLPVVAVGEATAAAARARGLSVTIVGEGDGADAVAAAGRAGLTRLLHLAGREHRATGAAIRIVYASEAIDVEDAAIRALAGGVALVHSARAAARLAALVDRAGVDRGLIALAAISRAALDAAGGGWATAASADAPTDAALVALARRLAIDRPKRGGDKAA